MTLKMQRTQLSLFTSVKDPTWNWNSSSVTSWLSAKLQLQANCKRELRISTIWPLSSPFYGKMLYVYDFLKRENRKRLKLKTGQNPTTTKPLPLVAPKIKSSRALNVTWRPRKRPLAIEDHMIVFWARKHNRLPPHPTGMTDFDKKCSYTQILPDR